MRLSQGLLGFRGRLCGRGRTCPIEEQLRSSSDERRRAEVGCEEFGELRTRVCGGWGKEGRGEGEEASNELDLLPSWSLNVEVKQRVMRTEQ